MSRAFALFLAVLLAPTVLLAQEPAQQSDQARREAHPISISGGIGFLSSIRSTGGQNQFLMQFDGLYHFTNNLAAGVTLQAGPSSRSSTVAMSFDGRVYLPLGKMLGNEEGILGRLVPYAGAGIGFRTYTSDFPFFSGTTDFLFSPTLGLEYDVTDNLSISTDMRFNVTSGVDNFYYSWQLIGTRLRF
jgi:opacity protein-like surface antigen